MLLQSCDRKIFKKLRTAIINRPEAAAYYLPQKRAAFFAFSAIKLMLIGNKCYQCKLVCTGTMIEWCKKLTMKTLT